MIFSESEPQATCFLTVFLSYFPAGFKVWSEPMVAQKGQTKCKCQNMQKSQQECKSHSSVLMDSYKLIFRIKGNDFKQCSDMSEDNSTVTFSV